jgi:hypothetical protein
LACNRGRVLNKQNFGLVTVTLGLLSAIAAVIIASRPVTNVWGQNCGSVFSPEKLIPLSELTRVLEEAAFDTACPEAWSPLVGWAIGLAAVAAVMIGIGAYLFLGPKNPPRGRPVPPKRQLSEELERVQNLYKSGGLTEEEYTAAKSRLLGDKGA